MALVFRTIKVAHTKANGRIIDHMAKVLRIGLMVLATRESGKMDAGQALESIPSRMVQLTMDSGLSTSAMAWESKSGRTEGNTMDSGLITSAMAWESKSGRTAGNTTASGLITNWMDTVSYSILVDTAMMVSSNLARDKAMGSTHGQTEQGTTAGGSKISNTDMVPSLTKKEFRRLVCGRMASELCGSTSNR